MKTPAQEEQEIKHELMGLMDRLMDFHDKNIGKQRQMIADYNTANELGNDLSQTINQGDTMNETQFTHLMSALDKVNSDLNTYKRAVQSLLSKIPNVESKTYELKTKKLNLEQTNI